MSTLSATGFEWSVKLIGGPGFKVGITSQLEAEENHVSFYDPNAILYSSGTGAPTIQIGSGSIIHYNLSRQKNEEIIRFRFQPHAKKLIIDLVRIRKAPHESPVPHKQFQNEHYEIDLQDNVNYFPVVQCIKEAHLIT